jgi:transposase
MSVARVNRLWAASSLPRSQVRDLYRSIGSFLALRDQLEMVKGQVLVADRHILAWHRSSEVSQRLDDIPSVGPLIASALVASVPDPHAFKSGRDLAAWIGLVPKQNSTGGKDRLGHISKAGI